MDQPKVVDREGQGSEKQAKGTSEHRPLPKFGDLRLVWLQSFVGVVEGGKTSAIAADLKVDQSTVSRNITSLEQWCRKVLIDLSGHKRVLTKDGAEFFPIAKGLIEQLSEFRHPDLDKNSTGPISFTVFDCHK